MIKTLSKAFALVSILILFNSCTKNSFSKLQKSGTLTEKYRAALKYFDKEDYTKAGLLFEELTPLMRGDSTGENVLIKNAYCNYYLRQYQMASYQFKNFYTTYANSPLAEEATYMAANCLYKDAPPYYLDQSETQTAIEALQSFINAYPYSDYVDKCTQDLKDLRLRLETKDYEKAVQYFETRKASINGLFNYKSTVIAIDNFKKDFPDSKYVEELSYIQVVSQLELAEVSVFSKQRERFEKGITLYHNFIDKFPNSKYTIKLIPLYEDSNKKLDGIIKSELALKEIQKDDAEKLQLNN